MLDGNCTNIKVILILSVWGILEEKISRTDREGGRNQANQLKYWNKKVIQRLPYYFSSRDGVGMHLPCLWPDFDILILDVGIVSCFSRKCLNFRFGAFHSLFFRDRQCISVFNETFELCQVMTFPVGRRFHNCTQTLVHTRAKMAQIITE